MSARWISGTYLCLLLTHSVLNTQHGIISVPVTDVVGNQLPTTLAYAQLPWAAQGSNYAACPRLHQLIFHEIVEILGYKGDQIRVRIPNLFYQTADSSTPQTEYWMQRAHIYMLERIHPTVRHTLPAPITFRKTSQTNERPIQQSIVTLIAPYHDPTIGLTFSAGTRFVRAAAPTAKGNVSVYCFDPHIKNIRVIFIPRRQLYARQKTAIQQRADFIAILRYWVHLPGIIPYLWGGCSLTGTDDSEQFTTIERAGGYYERSMRIEMAPKTGFDCSGLITRAAQIVGIPYFFKNSYTILRQLEPLKQNELMQQGDLIWLPGHVLILSDRDAGLFIEAHAYGSGYGRVHELPINRIFKGVTTIQELEHAWRNHRPLERLNKAGKVFAAYSRFALLKLPVFQSEHHTA